MTAALPEEEAPPTTSLQLNDDVARLPRRRPLELIIQAGGGPVDALALHTVPLASLDEASRRCLQSLHPGYAGGRWSLAASCDGLLLLVARGPACIEEHLLVCNPVTRQRAAVPPPSTSRMARACGFYLHGPSGEHRIVFLDNDEESAGLGSSASHHVRSLEAGETRRLGPAAAALHMYSRIPKAFGHRGDLHWIEHPETEDAGDVVLVFDTVRETFRRMARPPVGSGYYAADKSTIVPMHTSTDAVSALQSTLGCQVGTFPQTYLGLPLSSEKLRLSAFTPLIAKTDRYLSGWQATLLNPMGRAVLVDTVLDSQLVYAMSVMLLLQGTLDAVDRRRRAFLWSGEAKVHGAQCLVAWERVCQPKSQGGLGLKQLATQNKCLLLKLLHRLHVPGDSAWAGWVGRLPPPPPPRLTLKKNYAADDLVLMEADGMLATAAIRGGSVDIWVMEDHDGGERWTRRHRLDVDLPPPLPDVGWASVMMVGQNAILLRRLEGHAAALYDLTEKRVMKQLQLSRTDYLTAHVFRDSLERHAFFDLLEQS
ncbi:unnamed protein product [Urochloa decumbens]|uniref:F-box associated beta-propeller type 1 domain-containing protein n=1 Tax=Urochloa decumbens TaxID=240449 RepID=A0ABC9GJQ8_9POAL